MNDEKLNGLLSDGWTLKVVSVPFNPDGWKWETRLVPPEHWGEMACLCDTPTGSLEKLIARLNQPGGW
jgi:hypothetical protein